MGRAQGTISAVASPARHTARRERFRTGAGAIAFLGPRAGSLLGALADHHPYTGRHSLHVANSALATGTELGLSRRELDELTRVALLHDVGKRYVSTTLLDASGRPNEAEWAALAAHSDNGARMVSEAVGDPELTAAVRAIHERLDGDGYPDRLSDDEIPLYARIVAVCDAYDAMTSSERNYQRTLDSDAALECLREDPGHFDQDVVEAFSRCVDGARD